MTSIAAKVVGRVYHTERALVLDKRLLPAETTGKGEIDPRRGGWSAREPTPEELLVFARRNGFERKVASYLNQGGRCFMAFDEGEPVGMIWWMDGGDVAARGNAQVERFGIVVTPEDVYSYDLYVVPSRRGSGVGTTFFAAFEDDLARRGYVSVHGWVDERNHAARWLYVLRRFRTGRIVTSRVVLRRIRLTERKLYIGPERSYRQLGLWSATFPKLRRGR